MTTAAEQTYLPADDTDSGATAFFEFVEAHARGDRTPRYALVDADGAHVEIPGEVHAALLQVVEAMRSGLAVTVAPQSMTLTSQQAADLLGVSRPTLIKKLDSGELVFDRIGTHRRIQLRDLLDYRERRRAAQYAALEATAVDFGDKENVETVLAELRSARKAVNERRRARS